MAEPASSSDDAGIRQAFRRPFTVNHPVPATVKVGSWILLSVGALGLAQLLVTVITTDWATYPGTVALPPGFVPFMLVVVVVAYLTQIVFAVLVRQAFNWARVASAVFTAIALTALFVGFTPLAALETLATTGAIVLVWLPPSNRYFRRVRDERRLSRIRQLGSN